MKNPHIIVGEPRRCLCGMYGIAELHGERPTSCADILAALERLVQTRDPDARLLAEVIGPLVMDCDLPAAESEATYLKLRVGALREMLAECFVHLGQEIERKHLNDSARDGTQTLSRRVAEVLDASSANNQDEPRPSRDVGSGA